MILGTARVALGRHLVFLGSLDTSGVRFWSLAARGSHSVHSGLCGCLRASHIAGVVALVSRDIAPITGGIASIAS